MAIRPPLVLKLTLTSLKFVSNKQTPPLYVNTVNPLFVFRASNQKRHKKHEYIRRNMNTKSVTIIKRSAFDVLLALSPF